MTTEQMEIEDLQAALRPAASPATTGPTRSRSATTT